MHSLAMPLCRSCQQGQEKRPEACGVANPTHPDATRCQIIVWIIACTVVLGFVGPNLHVMSTISIPLPNQMGHSGVPSGCQSSATSVVLISMAAW